MKDEQLQKLLRMKRLESPGREYFEGFVAEFHRYQRMSLLEESRSTESWWGRVIGWVSVKIERPALVLGATAAVVLAFWVFLPGSPSPHGVALERVAEISSTLAAVFPGEIDAKLSPFDRDFASARFVTGEERLLAYDGTLTF